MILYGRYLSPFVRRVAIWLALQDRAFEHRPLSVMGDDFEALKRVNPFGRVPALAIDDGMVLVETSAIIDWLEETALAGKRLLPATGRERMTALQGVACANSVAEKGVALVYETTRRPKELHWRDWIDRVETQVRVGLDLLEAQAPDEGFASGGAPNGVTAAVVASWDFIAMAHPYLVESGYPKMKALSERANALPQFAASRP